MYRNIEARSQPEVQVQMAYTASTLGPDTEGFLNKVSFHSHLRRFYSSAKFKNW